MKLFYDDHYHDLWYLWWSLLCCSPVFILGHTRPWQCNHNITVVFFWGHYQRVVCLDWAWTSLGSSARHDIYKSFWESSFQWWSAHLFHWRSLRILQDVERNFWTNSDVSEKCIKVHSSCLNDLPHRSREACCVRLAGFGFNCEANGRYPCSLLRCKEGRMHVR